MKIENGHGYHTIILDDGIRLTSGDVNSILLAKILEILISVDKKLDKSRKNG